MKKTIIKRKVSINAPLEKVWNALADFGNVQYMSPNIAKSYLTSESLNGVGAKRHCDFTSMGAQVEEEITEWNDNESLRIRLYDPKNMPMIRDMEALFKVSANGPKTKLVGTFEYGMSNGIGKLLNNLKMKSMNIKNWETFMAGIKHFVETDQKVDKSTKLDLTLIEEER